MTDKKEAMYKQGEEACAKAVIFSEWTVKDIELAAYEGYTADGFSDVASSLRAHVEDLEILISAIDEAGHSPMCDSCWADKYSTQSIGGVVRPFKEILKEQLVESGLWFKDGETRGEWQERIALEGRSALRRFTGRKTGKVGVHKG